MRRPLAPPDNIDLLSTCHVSARRYLPLYGLLVLIALAAWTAAYRRWPLPLPPLVVVGIGLAALIAILVHPALVHAATTYRIFRTSLELHRGLLSRRIDNLQLFRVRDLSLSQGLLGRLIGIGDVILTSTDASTPRLVLHGLSQPRRTYDMLRRLVSASQATRQTMIVES